MTNSGTPHRLGSGEVSILVAAAAYGVSTTLSVAALRAVRPVDLLAIELTGAAAVLLSAAALTGRLRRRGALRQLLLGGLDPGLVFLLGDLGLHRTSASTGSLLLAAEPLLSALLAVFFLRERQPGRAVVALVVGFVGSALVAFDPAGGLDGGTTAGNLLVLAAVLVAGVYLILTRHYSDDGDGLSNSAWQTTGGLVCMAPVIAVTWAAGGSRLATAGTAGWVSSLAVLLCGAVGGAMFNRGIGRVPAARTGQLLNLTPAVGLLTAIVLLGERPTLFQLAGGATILIGLALLLRGAPAAEPPLLLPDNRKERSHVSAVL